MFSASSIAARIARHRRVDVDHDAAAQALRRRRADADDVDAVVGHLAGDRGDLGGADVEADDDLGGLGLGHGAARVRGSVERDGDEIGAGVVVDAHGARRRRRSSGDSAAHTASNRARRPAARRASAAPTFTAIASS
jgi:hypothetical protein